jgi:hypothetical protein
MLKHQIQTASLDFKTLGQTNGIQPDPETIAKLAYQLWSQRGKPEGSPEVDWFHAEHLLRSGDAIIG